MKTSELLFKAATLIENKANANYYVAENSGCWAIIIALEIEAGLVNTDGKAILSGCLTSLKENYKAEWKAAMEYFELFKPEDTTGGYWWGRNDGPRLLALYMAAHMAASDGN